MCDVTEWLGEFQLSQSDLKIECDDKIFLTLIQTILDLETTSASLGLTEAEIESLIIDHTTNRARKLHMLWMWKRKNGSSATYLALVRAMPTHIYVCVFIIICLSVCVCMYMCVCVCTYVCKCVYVCVHVCI